MNARARARATRTPFLLPPPSSVCRVARGAAADRFRPDVDGSLAAFRSGGLHRMVLVPDAEERFVGGIPWTHVDIAGPAFSEKSRPWTDGGATGSMVRPLVELARAGG